MVSCQSRNPLRGGSKNSHPSLPLFDLPFPTIHTLLSHDPSLCWHLTRNPNLWVSPAGIIFSSATPCSVPLPCLTRIERGHMGPSAYTLSALDQDTAQGRRGLPGAVCGVRGGEGLWTGEI